MTDEQRRFMHARQRVAAQLLDPVSELLSATTDLVAKHSLERDTALEATKEMWDALGVDNYAAALDKIRRLVDASPSII